MFKNVGQKWSSWHTLSIANATCGSVCIYCATENNAMIATNFSIVNTLAIYFNPFDSLFKEDIFLQYLKKIKRGEGFSFINNKPWLFNVNLCSGV